VGPIKWRLINICTSANLKYSVWLDETNKKNNYMSDELSNIIFHCLS